MPVPLDVSIFLNNALSARHVAAELESDTPLPEVIREMPESVSGSLVGLDESSTAEFGGASPETVRVISVCGLHAALMAEIWRIPPSPVSGRECQHRRPSRV